MTRLGDVLADIKPGFASRDNLEEGVFQFRMHNFTRESALDLTKRRRVNATVKQISTQSVSPGDVLFNATNSPELVGKSALIGTLDEPAVFSNHFMRLRTDPSQLEPGYLAHFLRFQFSRGVFRAMAKAWVNQATVGRDRLEALQIPLPSLDDQRRIATILDHADAIRIKRRQNLTHLDTLTQSIFHDMFAGHENEMVPLADLAAVTSGITKGRRTAEPTSPTPYLAVSNVQAGRLKMDVVKEIDATTAEIDRYALKDGDLVLTEGGDPDKLGRGTVWRSELPLCLHQNHVFRVRSHSVEPDYLTAFMASRSARSYFLRAAKQTTGIASINMTQLKALPVPVPSGSDQSTFVERMNGVEGQRVAMKRSVAANDELFASLQSRAFRGEL